MGRTDTASRVIDAPLTRVYNALVDPDSRRFHREFLVNRDVPVTDEPPEYPQYWPGYYAVFFDDSINGTHWELAWVPKVPTPRQVWSFYRAIRGFAKSRPYLAKTVAGVTRQARRALPTR